MPLRTDGTCPYCGGNPASGGNCFEGVVREDETPAFRAAQRRRNRLWGALEFVGGALWVGLLLWRVQTSGRASVIGFLAGGILAAHGLVRVIFGSGPKIIDDDFDFGPKD